MIERRRVRFANIDGITRTELPIAAEIWLEEITTQAWVTRDIHKLAIHFKRFMANPDPKDVTFRAIERNCQLDRKQAIEALRQMQMFGIVEAFGVEEDGLRVSLHLSLMQRLRALEAARRLSELGASLNAVRADNPMSDRERWLPAQLEPIAEAEAPAAQA